MCAAAWITFDVHFNDSGHISGLFYTGSDAHLPPELDAHTYRVHDATGYDGQFYHLIAHDPLNRRGYLAFVDNPQLRWRRIGLPALAAFLAGGSDRIVDPVFVAIQLVFVFLGAYWLSLYAQTQRMSWAWGIGVLVIPAAAVSLDRMTIDLPLAAIAIALALEESREQEGQHPGRALALLAAAPLIRETGIVLVAAWCIRRFVMQDRRNAIQGLACALPALGWWAYVRMHSPPDGTAWMVRFPFSGLMEQTAMSGKAFGASAGQTIGLRTAAVFENIALVGIWLAIAAAIYLLLRRRWGFLEITAVGFAAFAGMLGKLDIWSSAYATGRTMSPLLIALALLAMKERRAWLALPLLLFVPRIALQYEAEIRTAFRS